MYSEWLVHREEVRQRDKQAHTQFLLHQTLYQTHTHAHTYVKKGTACARLQSREHCDNVRWISTGNCMDRIRAASQRCGCIWAYKHTL